MNSCDLAIWDRLAVRCTGLFPFEAKKTLVREVCQRFLQLLLQHTEWSKRWMDDSLHPDKLLNTQLSVNRQSGNKVSASDVLSSHICPSKQEKAHGTNPAKLFWSATIRIDAPTNL